MPKRLISPPRARCANAPEPNLALPARAPGVACWWRDNYRYREFSIAVYSLVPVTDSEIYHFIRDDLAVTEEASRLLARPPRWNWADSGASLAELVRYHIMLCNNRLEELDEANDESEDEELAWEKKPVFDPYSFLVLTRHPERTDVILAVTLNDSRGLCYTDCALIPVAKAFPPLYAMQRGECTWTAVKHLVGDHDLDDDSQHDEACLEALRKEEDGVVEWIGDPTREDWQDAPTAGENDSDDISDAEMHDDDQNRNGGQEDGVAPARVTAAERRARLARERARHYIPEHIDYTSYTFAFFYMAPSRLIRPVKRTWLYEYVNYISAFCTGVRDDHNSNDGVIEPLYRDRAGRAIEYDWERILQEFPPLCQAVTRERRGFNTEYFLVWDHEKDGMLACKLRWNESLMERCTQRDLRSLRLKRRDVEVVRIMPELDAVDFLRQIANETELVPEWETLAKVLTEDD